MRGSVRAGIIGVAGALALAGGASAEVMNSDETGFALSLSFETTATPEQAWAALITPSAWWSSDHSYSGDAKNFSLDVAPGGCFCEIWDGGAVKHGEVVQFRTPSAASGGLVRLEGGLGPLQNLAVGQVQDWTIDPSESGGAKVSYTTRVSGRTRDGFAQLAPTVDGVMTEQIGRLERYLATGSPEE